MARIKDIIREYITSIPALVEKAALRLFGDTGLATESFLDTNVLSVVRNAVSHSVAKTCKTSARWTAVELAVQKYLAEFNAATELFTRTIDAPAFTVTMTQVCEAGGRETLLRKDQKLKTKQYF